MISESALKPEMKSKTKNKKAQEFPSDRKILDSLYNHYGKPKNIVKEKVKLYKGYSTPAGYKLEDWKLGEYQLGRVTVFTGVKDHPDDLYEKTRIEEEGKGTWFVGVKHDSIKVWIGSELNTIIKIEE
tara:strand:- start:779 stop:1162 length:384 start_codon:yes stop_codon:yes gene_type:complete